MQGKRTHYLNAIETTNGSDTTKAPRIMSQTKLVMCVVAMFFIAMIGIVVANKVQENSVTVTLVESTEVQCPESNSTLYGVYNFLTVGESQFIIDPRFGYTFEVAEATCQNWGGKLGYFKNYKEFIAVNTFVRDHVRTLPQVISQRYFLPYKELTSVSSSTNIYDKTKIVPQYEDIELYLVTDEYVWRNSVKDPYEDCITSNHYTNGGSIDTHGRLEFSKCSTKRSLLCRREEIKPCLT